MKNVFQSLATLLLILPGFILQSQVTDYCGILKVSIQNVKEISNGLEFDIYLRSAKKTSEACGDLYLGHTDIWVKLTGGDFNEATIEKLGESTFSPEKAANQFSNYMVQQNYTNGSSAKIIDNRVVVNVGSPAGSNLNDLQTNFAFIDTKPRTHKLGRYRITGYHSTQAPVLAIQNMDKGISVVVDKKGYDRFCSKSHTNALDGNRVTSYAIQVVPDHFLREDLTKFDARRIDMKSAQIDWEIDRSELISTFTLERSTDGINWNNIEKLNGNNNDYEYLDKDVYDGKEIQKIVYYRLKLESEDDYDYSKVKTVVFSNVIMTGNPDASNEGLTIYPNPTTEGVFVDMSGLDDMVQVDKIQILDMGGKLIIDREVLPNVRKEYIRFENKDELSRGMYFVQLVHGEVLVDQKKLEIQ